jgi:hypothetical protein
MKLLTLIAFVISLKASASPRHFADLGGEDQKRVKTLYGDLLNAHEKKDFEKMSSDSHSILALLDDYNDTKAYAAIAQRRIEQAKEDKDPETQKRKDRALHDLAALEIKGQGMLAKAKSDPDARAELYKTMNEILKLDPSNTYPAEWRNKLHND